MLIDREIRCPHCGESTTIGVSAAEPGAEFEQRGTLTQCRRCRRKLVTLTQPDGTVAVFKPSDVGLPDADGSR